MFKNPFKMPTLTEVMQRELEQSQLQLLASENARELADAQVRLMTARITRLQSRLAV